MRAAVTAVALTMVALTAAPTTASPRPRFCLPPVFDHGQRLHPLPNPDVYWLEITLRQHELCWRAPASPDELRVLLIGNSAIFGLPLPIEQTLGVHLNQRFARTGTAAHLFNLGFVTPYQVRDALIINEALPYKPDVIVYPMTLGEFRHLAPIIYPTTTRFFDVNDAALKRAAADPPTGLEEPFATYLTVSDNRRNKRHATDHLRETGLYVRRLARAATEAFAFRVNGPLPPFQSRARTRQKPYDCGETERVMKSYDNWKNWNVLAYLDDLQRTRGIRSLVVHWPVAHEPNGNCYSERYTNALVDDFSAWIRTETERRQLAYVDLRDFLSPDAYIDSLHVTPEGHRQIAERIGPALDQVLQAAAAQRRTATERP